MQAKLSRADGPLYRQAADRLRQEIGSGTRGIGTELPTEAALAQSFGVSLITVRQALRALADDGLIRKRSAKAALVVARTPGAPAAPLARDMSSFADIVAATQGAVLEIDSYRPAASREAGAVFGSAYAPPRTNAMRLHGRMLTQGSPVSEITIYFPPAIGRRLRRADFDNVVVFRSVERCLGIRLADARVTVSAELADRRLAALLGCAEGSAVLTSRILYFDAGGQPVEYTVARHRADAYELSYRLKG